MRRFLPWLFLAILWPTGSGLRAQPVPEKVERIDYSSTNETGHTGHGPATPQYAFAVLATLLLLVMLCYPSRKHQ